MTRLTRPFLGAALALAFAFAQAEPATVCTITVNSPDEREAFRDLLPKDKYRFVELAERGRRDWLGAACQAQVRCDVLVISGHFAGTDFYSSQHGEHLPVAEIERVACSDSCPDLFSQLKEVYLFGCDTLKAEPVKSAAPEIVRGLVRAGRAPAEAAQLARLLSERHAESARERMRRAFPGVPVIYGFSSLAPYGRVAGPMLRGYLQGGAAGSVGSGEVSRTLLKLFGPSSMVATEGARAADADADYRAEACRYRDDRVTAAQRFAFVHRTLAGEMPELRMAFDRIEAFLASLTAAEREDPEFRMASERLQADKPVRERYLALTRETHDPALRLRMVSLARDLGWLARDEERAELLRLAGDILAQGSAGFAEVELICSLDRASPLEAELRQFRVAHLASTPARAAALACLGDAESRPHVLQALLSPQEGDVQVAQAYLRHRPISDEAELHALVREVARMRASSAQVRALETIARQGPHGSRSLEELARLLEQTPSPAVQRAVAEIFLRAGAREVPRSVFEKLLRLRGTMPAEGRGVVDALIERLRPG